MEKTPLALRVESLTTENLQNCAKALFDNHQDGASEALVAILDELAIRMGDDFAEWADTNF